MVGIRPKVTPRPKACPFCQAAAARLESHCPNVSTCPWWTCDLCGAVMSGNRWFRVSTAKQAPPT